MWRILRTATSPAPEYGSWEVKRNSMKYKQPSNSHFLNQLLLIQCSWEVSLVPQD
jgi:hypothetical protein